MTAKNPALAFYDEAIKHAEEAVENAELVLARLHDGRRALANLHLLGLELVRIDGKPLATSVTVAGVDSAPPATTPGDADRAPPPPVRAHEAVEPRPVPLPKPPPEPGTVEHFLAGGGEVKRLPPAGSEELQQLNRPVSGVGSVWRS